MPTPSQNSEDSQGGGSRPSEYNSLQRSGPTAQTMTALASRVGPLVIGAGVVAASRAMPFSLEELARLEKSWRFDAI
jgi:hypothetical protein